MPRVDRRAALGAALLCPTLVACVAPGSPPACAVPLKPAVELSLYFGRDKPAGGEVSDAEWASFLADTVTPQFPAGLTVIDARGQHRDPAGVIASERTKLVIVVVFDVPAHRARVASIVETYTKRFGQHEVFRVEQSVCAG
jgi:hypothetical protein